MQILKQVFLKSKQSNMMEEKKIKLSFQKNFLLDLGSDLDKELI